MIDSSSRFLSIDHCLKETQARSLSIRGVPCTNDEAHPEGHVFPIQEGASAILGCPATIAAMLLTSRRVQGGPKFFVHIVPSPSQT